jgi:hypothetical protein
MNANVYANLIIVYHPYFLKTEHLIIYNLGIEIISHHIYMSYLISISALSCQLNKLPVALRYLIIKAVSFLPKFSFTTFFDFARTS